MRVGVGTIKEQKGGQVMGERRKRSHSIGNKVKEVRQKP